MSRTVGCWPKVCWPKLQVVILEIQRMGLVPGTEWILQGNSGHLLPFWAGCRGICDKADKWRS